MTTHVRSYIIIRITLYLLERTTYLEELWSYNR